MTCLEKAFMDIVIESKYYERNISISFYMATKAHSINYISKLYKITPNRIRQIFRKVCNTIYYRFKEADIGYHMRFYEPTKKGEVNYDAFFRKENFLIFLNLCSMSRKFSESGQEVRRRGWK